MTSLFQVFVGLYHRVRGIDQNKEKTEEKTEEKSEPPEKKKKKFYSGSSGQAGADETRAKVTQEVGPAAVNKQGGGWSNNCFGEFLIYQSQTQHMTFL